MRVRNCHTEFEPKQKQGSLPPASRQDLENSSMPPAPENILRLRLAPWRDTCTALERGWTEDANLGGFFVSKVHKGNVHKSKTAAETSNNKNPVGVEFCRLHFEKPDQSCVCTRVVARTHGYTVYTTCTYMYVHVHAYTYTSVHGLTIGTTYS